MNPRFKDISVILRLLAKTYGVLRTPGRSDPIDELIRTVLSQNTTDVNSLKAFSVLKRNFKKWDKLLSAGTKRVAGLIRHAGLANIKAKRIKGILREIKRREGKIALPDFSKLSIPASMGYLMSLKGVGPKTASCVLLFSFDKPVMPVDTHIFRVAKRLGLIDKSADIGEAHKTLSGMLSDPIMLRLTRGQYPGIARHRQAQGLIYAFHLGIIEHGRKTCRARDPRCGCCVLYSLCRFQSKKVYRKNRQCR